MFKAIKKFFQKPDETVCYQVVSKEKPSVLDRVFEDVKSKNRNVEECRTLVGEPVLTLAELVLDNPKRFKLHSLTYIQYKEELDKNYQKKPVEIYDWMKTGNCSYVKYVDTKTGVTHTVIIEKDKGRIYRVDGLPFQLNHWEMVVLTLVFRKKRKATTEKLRERRKRNTDNKRRTEEQREKDARHEYMRMLK